MHRRTSPRFWMIVIAFMLISFTISFLFAQHTFQQSALALAEAQEARDALIDRIEELTMELDFAQTDEYVIRIARNELGMIMPNTVRYINGN